MTLPHKEAAFHLVDGHDENARRMGAVNTVLVGADGRLGGRNTDGAGFLANLRQQVAEWRPNAGAAVLLGTGGAARAVAFALIDAGVRELRLVNRTLERAQALAQDLAAADAEGCAIETVGWERKETALDGCGLLAQCTLLGMKGQPPLDLPLDHLPETAIVTDLVYTPLETPLLRAARDRGNRTVDGLGMLLHQAVPGFTHWGGGITPAVDDGARQCLLDLLATRSPPP